MCVEVIVCYIIDVFLRHGVEWAQRNLNLNFVTACMFVRIIVQPSYTKIKQKIKVPIIFRLNLHTITLAQMMFSGGEGH